MTHSFNHKEIKGKGRFQLSVKENVRIKKDKIKRHFLSSNYVFPPFISMVFPVVAIFL